MCGSRGESGGEDVGIHYQKPRFIRRAKGEARAAKFFIPLCDTRFHIHEQNHLGTHVSPEAEYNYRCYITIVIESTENAAPVKDFPRRYR